MTFHTRLTSDGGFWTTHIVVANGAFECCVELLPGVGGSTGGERQMAVT